MSKNNEWEELTTTFKSNPVWDYREEGQGAEFTGVYQATRTGIGQNGMTIYDFLTEKGEDMSVWGNSSLNMTMLGLVESGDVVKGATLKLVYEGKLKNPKTGRMFHSFKVYRKIGK